MYFGEKNSAADKLLGDFRKGYLGNLALEAPPKHNAAHNRLPLKPSARVITSGPLGGGGVDAADVVLGAAAKEAREFIGTGDFEGW